MRERLKERLLPIPKTASLRATTGDHDTTPGAWEALPSGRKLRAAAVLVPIVEHPEEPTVLLTTRTEHLRNHSGQVSFPGGRMEDYDNGPVDTALRETFEEIGLGEEFIDILGALDVYETGTGYSITPIVGLVRPGFELTIDKFEVANAFEVPLDFFMDPANHTLESREWQGRMRHYYVMPYGDHYIWGATAGMLVNLYRKLVS